MDATPEFALLAPIPHNLTVGIASTVDKLVELTEAAAQRARGDEPRALEDHIWQLWTSLLEIAARTPLREQKKLVALVSQLQKRSLSDLTTGEPLKHDDGAIWTELPTLGWVVRDAWNFNVLDPEASEEALTRWEMKTAFLAQLTALPQASEAKNLDFSLYALWAFRDAFETAAGESSTPAIRAASLWFIYAGDKLWQNVKEERSFPGNAAASGEKAPVADLTGFNNLRWFNWLQACDAARPEGDSSWDLVAKAKAAVGKATRADR